MKKRFFAIFLVVVLLFSLASCGGDNGNSADDIAKDVSMLAIFSPMFSISKVTADDVLIAYYGNCPIYLSFILNDGETVSEDGSTILDANGDTVATVSDRCSVFAYAMSACVFNYVSGIEIDTKTLYSYEEYQTQYLRAAGYPDSTDTKAVGEFISDESAYDYLESFIAQAAETLIKGDESLREKATSFIYEQLVADGTLNEDRTLTEGGMAQYKNNVLIASKYAYLTEIGYVSQIESLFKNHYTFGTK
ncbi:MAG: hypothetical protein IJY12_02625 [Clostridia bacterium]|nr:hypothetical protein [Clostridia bacterium]